MAILITTIEDSEPYHNNKLHLQIELLTKEMPKFIQKIIPFFIIKHLSKIQEEPSDTIFQVTILKLLV